MNPQLTTRLRHLRLSGIVDALPARVAQAEAAPLPHLEFLELLVEDELARRADRLFARRLKQAGITVVKTLCARPRSALLDAWLICDRGLRSPKSSCAPGRVRASAVTSRPTIVGAS